jgi:tetratricopeptide (TPR) repeat protein
MKMRCPKCGESFVVNKPGSAGGGAKPPPPPRPRGSRPTAGGGGQSVGAPTPPPTKKPLFSGGGNEGQAPPRKQASTAIAGSINIPALAEIGSSEGTDDGFGVLDMSLPGDAGPGFADGPDDLPIAADQADLPMPADRADLPMPAQGHGGHMHGGHMPGGAPPMPADGNLPMPAADGDLPVPVAGADLPMPAHYHDLPVPAEHGDLPAPAEHGDLPAPAAHGDLPTPAQYGDLPLPGDGDLPAPAEHADLPLPHMHGDLPVPNDQDLPLPSAGGDLPLPADQDLPLPSDGGDLPLPADFNFPESAHGDLPTAAMDSDFPAPGGTQELGDVGLASEPPRPAPPRREGAGVGDEFAIDEVEEGGLATAVGEGMGVEGPRVPLKKKKRTKGLRIAIVAISAIGLGGGLLTLTPLGPYGAYAINDALNADAYQNEVATFRTSAQEQLDKDTAREASALFTQAKNKLAQMPRFDPMAGYAAFLAFNNVLRFGDDPATLASGRQILSDNEPAGDMAILAQAALAAVDGKLSEAQAKLNPLAQRLPDDIDVSVLSAEIALRGDAPKDAVTAWTEAVKMNKSARTLYGLTRAHLKADDNASAKKTAEQVLELSKNHAGARLAMAKILWRTDRTNKKVDELLTEVMTDGPVKAAASKAEQVEALSLVGSVHLSRAQMTEAEKAFKKALEIDPKSVRALVGNGELFYVAGRYSEALARYKAAREVDPKNINAIVGTAKTMLKMEQAKQARSELLALTKTNDHPLVGYWLGQAQQTLSDRKGAEATYRKTLKKYPKHPDSVKVYVALADLLGGKGNEDEAKKVLAEATEKLKESAALHNAKGDVALRGGRIPEAKKEFREALEIDPDNSVSRFRLAVAHRRARDFDAASAELKKLADADPNFPGLMLEQGLLLQLTGKTEEALKIYQQALDKAPDDLDLKLRVAAVQVISGYPSKAKPLLEAVHQKRPRSAEVNHYLGRATLATEDSAQQALTHLKLAATLEPSKADYHLWVAIAANKMKDFTAAEKAITKALEIDQNFAEAYWQRGVTLQMRGKTRDAIEMLQIALDKNPTLYEAYASIARSYQDQADGANAEKAWRKALEGDDTVAEWHFRLAKLMIARNAKEEALPHLKKSVELIKDDAKPAWLWNANYLLAEGLRNKDPKRALQAYEAFKKLTNAQNAYYADAEKAISEIKRQLLHEQHGIDSPKEEESPE